MFGKRLLIGATLLGCLAGFGCTPDDDVPPGNNPPVDENPLPEPDYLPEPVSGAYSLNLPYYFSPPTSIPADNPLTQEGVLLGRMLFYEKRLSGNNTMSCSSCHQQPLAFTDGKAFSTGITGHPTRRSTMALNNLLWVNKFFWDGRADSLEEQALIPIQDTLEMHQTLEHAVSKLQATSFYPAYFQRAFGSSQITSENIANALAQFVRTLVSSDSRYDRYLQQKQALTASEMNGMTLFFQHPFPAQQIRGGNCGDCHGGYLTSLNGFHNNGLDVNPTDIGLEGVTGQPYDRGKFRAPSLRNIALTAPYMHDGRFQTLEEVLNHYNEHIQLSDNPLLDPLIVEASNEVGGNSLLLTAQEKQDILAFLHALTDSTFIQDRRFADPFIKPGN